MIPRLEKVVHKNKKKDLSLLKNVEMRAAFRTFVLSDIEQAECGTNVDGYNALICEAMHNASNMLF